MNRTRFHNIESAFRNKKVFLSVSLIVFFLEYALGWCLVSHLVAWEVQRHWISSFWAEQIKFSILIPVSPACMFTIITALADDIEFWVIPLLVGFAFFPEIAISPELFFEPDKQKIAHEIVSMNYEVMPILFFVMAWFRGTISGVR